jgi:hypothetical protein
MKIVKCDIGPRPKSMFDPMPKVKVELENGEKKTLFSYYPDEIHFNEDEFIGLTETEAHQLKFKKDTQYLQS